MPRIHVCSLSRIADTATETAASHLVSLVNEGTEVVRPASIAAERHLFLGIADIIEPIDGMVTPTEAHVQRLLDFVETWDRQQPLLIHCFAGISRSTAAAFISLCAVEPARSEIEVAARLRAASPFATPNGLLILHADRLLNRKGRMVAAIGSIGRGEMAYEGNPFHLGLGGKD